MTKLYLLKGEIQNYAWGGKVFISNLLGREITESKNAEYWLGAHNSAPSKVITNSGEKLLDSFVNKNLKDCLGVAISEKFGRLPYLFKVLDVEEMLSIQVHPTKTEAEKGFEKENKLGIPLDAKNRNYKDDNHKPEIMVALSEFWLLHGFLSEEKLADVLKTTNEFKPLVSVFEEQGYRGLYKTVMEESQETTNKVLKSLIDRIVPLYKTGQLEKSNPDYWAAKTVVSSSEINNLDKGIYSIYFFNIMKASKGEAVFQDAGIPHAYLEGQNMELMANSDNVLRGGLTPKHIDVLELLKHIRFEATIPNIMQGELQNDGFERIYKSIAPDFELSQIKLVKNDNYSSKSNTTTIVIFIKGNGQITEGETKINFKQGESALLLANSNYQITTETEAVIYKATAP